MTLILFLFFLMIIHLTPLSQRAVGIDCIKDKERKKNTATVELSVDADEKT